MTDQTEREAMVALMESAGDPGFLTFQEAADAILAGGFHLTPTPHVVTTGEELAEAQSDSDWGYVAVRDAEHRPWIVWDTEQGDFLATSFPTEDDVEHIHGDQHRAVPPIIDARDIPLPATVLTPAPAPVDREALVEAGARALDTLDRENRSRWESWADDTDPSTKHTPPRDRDNRDRARAVLDALEGAR